MAGTWLQASAVIERTRGGSLWRRLTEAVIACLSLAAHPASAASGQLIRYPDFKSAVIEPREVTVWLPEGYDPAGPGLPVLYMHDGENLYDSRHSLSGANWGVDATVTRLIAEHRIRPVIVVGIASTRLRGREYLPQRIFDGLPAETRQQLDAGWGGAPLSDEYLRFIVRELKPFVDEHYRTLRAPSDTFIMGSSMGGLISFYAQSEYPETFGGSASLSMHWLLGSPSNRLTVPDYPAQVTAAFARYLDASALPPQTHRIYVDQGTETLDAAYRPFSLAFEKLMAARGWRDEQHFASLVFPGASHSEIAWNARLETPLLYLLGTATSR